MPQKNKPAIVLDTEPLAQLSPTTSMFGAESHALSGVKLITTLAVTLNRS